MHQTPGVVDDFVWKLHTHNTEVETNTCRQSLLEQNNTVRWNKNGYSQRILEFLGNMQFIMSYEIKQIKMGRTLHIPLMTFERLSWRVTYIRHQTRSSNWYRPTTVFNVGQIYLYSGDRSGVWCMGRHYFHLKCHSRLRLLTSGLP